MFLPGAAPARADSCSVPSTGYPTIASALADGNCTFIFIAAGTFYEHSLQINRPLSLSGAGKANTIVDGNQADTIFYVSSGVTVTISGLRIQNGQAANGGGINTQGTLTLQAVGLRINKATNSGGGIYMTGGSLNMSASSLGSNSAVEGAGIDVEGGALTISSVVFINNHASDNGGGIRSSAGSLQVTGSTFYQNSVAGEGAGVYTSVPTQITRSKFTLNKSTGNGAAISQDGGAAPLDIDRTTFYRNVSKSWGGAINNQLGAITITNSLFQSNTSIGGGAMNNDGGTLNISGSTFANNLATTDIDGGGAIWASIPTTIVNSTFYSNIAQNGQGGGVSSDGSSMNLLNDTFFGNQAPRGGNISATTGTIYLQNTILSNGSPTNCAVIWGRLISQGSNLSSDSSCRHSLTAVGDMLARAPLLGPLSYNGGLTPTMIPQAGSPAINGVRNACPPPSTDQRGIARPRGTRCDIGAVETNQ